MESWLIAASLLAIGVVVVLWRLWQHVFAGIGEELGRRAVEQAAERRQLARRHRAAGRAARAGEDAPGVLCEAAGPIAFEKLSDLRRRLSPTADAATLLSSISEELSPFIGRPVVAVVVGVDADAEVAATLRDTGRDVIVAGHAVDPSRRGDSDPVDWLLDELQQTVATAQRQAVPGGAFVAVALRPPLTGRWSDEHGVDPTAIVDRLFSEEACDTWLTVRDPAQEGAWPSTVTVVLPTDPAIVQRALRNTGPPFPLSARIEGSDVTLPGPDAARLVAALSGLSPISMLGERSSPAYSPAVTLALNAYEAEGAAVVRRDSTETEAIQAFLKAAGVRILASPTDEVELKIPLSTFPVRTVAWRHAAPSSPRRDLVEARETDGALHHPFRWLGEAIESGDEQVAAAVLAGHGRAWLELAQPDSALHLIGLVHAAFPGQTAAFLWAHYLMAIDSALRLDAPDATWFTNDLCELAATRGLGLLFRAERMEFRRLRGDLRGAITEANHLTRDLDRPANINSPGDLYVAGTSRYVLANVLRRGGRYDLARQYIHDATTFLRDDIPSHRIELTHAMYGLSICDSMFGVASVQVPDGWGTTEAVFARSLVTLANSHASWFVKDYDRAAQFADQASAAFAGIGYQRYAQRADRLRILLVDWAGRAGRPVTGSAPPHGDERVAALLRVPINSTVEWLASERPSHVLSLLQFTAAFSEPDATRFVDLPEVVGIDSSGDLILYRPPQGISFASAQAILRESLGIGQSSPVPLAAD